MRTESKLTVNFESANASVAFIDLAGFSATTDVYGDRLAIEMLQLFEAIVYEALGNQHAPVKWIGDEVMLAFNDSETALLVLGKLLPACRAEPRLPLTRTGVHHGHVICRGGDFFGSTVNIAARITSIATPGQLLATKPVAAVAMASGISVQELGHTRLRSVANPMELYAIELAPTVDASWIDPVCKMHAPYKGYQKTSGPWFCSQLCADAYERNPSAYIS
jgi:class 3 adenylate cyclase/YHS domain-containing protein